MIDLPANALETLNRLFAKYVPHCEVRAFGSRVKWTSKDYSDLDLAIVCDEPIERKLFNRLKEEIEEIPINFRVDLLDWHKISSEFQKIIEEQYEIIYTETSSNSDEWKYYRVDEFAEIVGGGTPKTDIDAYWNGSIPWLTPKDLSGYTNRFISHGERYISAEGLKNSSAKLVPAGTVLLTSRAPVGYVAIAQNEVCTNQGFRSLIPKDGFDSEFIYYVLFHNTEYLKSHATGTTFQELSGGALKNLSFQIPSLKTQQKIVKILSSLDDKIALNREMNKTLEAMAQAIFKSWFIDFEPFRDGEFVESELGMIPQGWEVKTLLDLSEKISKGTTPTKKDVDQAQDQRKIQFLKVKDIDGNGEIKYSDIERISLSIHENQLKRSIVYTDDILFSIAGTIGRIAVVGECFHNSNVNQALAFIRLTDKKLLLDLVLLNLKSAAFQDSIQSRIVQGVQANVSLSVLGNMKIIVPSQIELEKFVSIVEPIRFQQNNLSTQTQTLSVLRDTLLPKLLSGEIEV